METFFVSLTGDLLHVYIKYQAESELAVEQYLERQYRRKCVWTLPWCAIYAAIPTGDAEARIINSTCGTLFEEDKNLTRKVQDTDTSLPSWTFRFTATVRAVDSLRAMRLGKIECANGKGIVEAIRQ